MVQRKTKENLKVLFLYQGGTDGTKERTCLGSRGVTGSLLLKGYVLASCSGTRTVFRQVLVPRSGISQLVQH